MSTQHTPELLEMVAVYALGGVDATTGECAELRAHIAQCPICQEEFRRNAATAAAIGRSAAQAPPPSLREKILASLPARVTPLAQRRQPTWFVPAAAAAAVVIAAGIWWNAHRQSGQTWAATCTPTAPSCHASGVLSVAGGALELQLHGLAALPSGKQYQAWLIMPGAAPKPEPVFSANQSGDGSVAIPEAPAKGDVVAVTIEPAGGSQKPTTAPFLVAKID